MRNPTYQNSDPKLGTTTTLSDLVDLDLLVIVKKCVRLCTIHPISKFVKYDHQSKVVQALVTNFAKTKILKTIHEAWQDPMGKKAILEDMHAQEKKPNLGDYIETKGENIGWMQVGIYNQVQRKRVY